MQSPSSSKRSSESGLAGILFLAIALICIVAMVLGSLSRHKSSGTSRDNDRMLASTMIEHMADYQRGYEKMTASGIDPTTITLDMHSQTGMHNPAPGAQYASPHQMPAVAVDYLTSKGTAYVYSAKHLSFPAGSNNSTPYDHLVHTGSGLTLTVCQHVNNLLHGDSLSLAPAQGAPPFASLNGSGGYFFSSANPRLVRLEGCLQTVDSGTRYVYYRILRAF